MTTHTSIVELLQLKPYTFYHVYSAIGRTLEKQKNQQR